MKIKKKWRPSGAKYKQFNYCPYCDVWLPKDSPEVVGRYHICGHRIRTKPRKAYAKSDSPRVNAESYGVLHV